MLKRVFAILLLAACVPKAETPVAEATSPELKFERPTATPPPDRDPLFKDYATAKDLISSYGGDERRLQQARAQLISILGRNRQYAPAYAGLAMIEYRTGYRQGAAYDAAALDRAAKYVDHALQLDPNLFDAHVAAAWIHRHRGDLRAARSSLDVAEGISPGATELKLARAELAEADSNPKEMLRFASEVLSASKNRSERAAAYQYVISAYTAGGHVEQADAAYRELLILTPDSAWAHANYAAFLLRRSDPDGAIREATRAVELSRDAYSVTTLADAYVQRADQLWSQGNINEADAYAARADALAAGNAGAAVLLGAWYERISRRTDDPAIREKAVNAYRKAIALDPANEKAKAGLKRLGA